MTELSERSSLRLTAACWPVFEFLTNLVRQVKHGMVGAPDQVHYEALSALRDAEDLARDDPATERLWNDRAKAMMVYLLDYKMINTEWEGRNYWFDNRFETDPNILDHAQALGGEDFFRDCDEMQREYELAERRDRRDKDELAELLSLYFVCLRLGFKGQYHDRPQELADYTRRLFTRLPTYASTRGKLDFAEAYEHNQEQKANYNLGMSLTVVLVAFVAIITISIFTFRMAWGGAVEKIEDSAEKWQEVRVEEPAP
ncbi:MAG: DotU family type IV/VI secretion system protein [Planctomycetota bacterium]|jgi:type VI protein secretion system component VasF